MSLGPLPVALCPEYTGSFSVSLPMFSFPSFRCLRGVGRSRSSDDTRGDVDMATKGINHPVYHFDPCSDDADPAVTTRKLDV